jgi:hypothetical protein
MNFGFADPQRQLNGGNYANQMANQARQVPMAPVSSPGASFADLIANVQKTAPTVTTVNKQNISPQLEALMNQFTGQMNALSGQTQQAYQGKQNTFADLISSLTNMYGAMGAGQSSAAQTSALASGLSPLEAQGAGNNVLQQVMQQFYPQLAQTKTQQADVGIAGAQAQQGILQQLGLPFMQSVQAPYFQNVAGQQQVTTDPLRNMSLLAQLTQAQGDDALGWAQLAQQGNQFQQSLANNQNQFGAGISADMQKVMAQLGGQKYGVDVGAQLQQDLAGQRSDLGKYLAMLSSGTQLGQTGMYTQAQLLNTQLGAQLKAQEATTQWNRVQSLLNTGASADMTSGIDNIWSGAQTGRQADDFGELN